MQYQTTRDQSAIAYRDSSEVVRTEVQTIVNISRPSLQAEGYAPVSVVQKGDRLPLYIGGALLAALVAMAGIHFSDGEKRELQAQNAQLVAEQNAIAGCIKGVTGQ